MAVGLTPEEPAAAPVSDQTVAELPMLAVPRLSGGRPDGALILKATVGVAIASDPDAKTEKAQAYTPAWFVAVKQDEYFRKAFSDINGHSGPLVLPAVYQALKEHAQQPAPSSSKIAATDLFVQQLDYFTINELRTPMTLRQNQ